MSSFWASHVSVFYRYRLVKSHCMEAIFRSKYKLVLLSDLLQLMFILREARRIYRASSVCVTFDIWVCPANLTSVPTALLRWYDTVLLWPTYLSICLPFPYRTTVSASDSSSVYQPLDRHTTQANKCLWRCDDLTFMTVNTDLRLCTMSFCLCNERVLWFMLTFIPACRVKTHVGVY